MPTKIHQLKAKTRSSNSDNLQNTFPENNFIQMKKSPSKLC